MLTTWSAFSSLDRLLDDVMSHTLGTGFSGSAVTADFAPAADIRTSEGEMVLSLDVPGIKQDDIEINLENGVLTVKGSRKYDGNEKERAWLGRRYGTFSVAYQLPDTVDVDRLEAQLADGVLTIRVPKHERAKARKIPVSLAGGSEHKQLTEKGS